MPFDAEAFAALRPCLFHLTARGNVRIIGRERRLDSMATLAQKAGRVNLINVRRQESIELAIHGDLVHIRDQAPLHANNMSLDDKWTFARFVSYLNSHVFFWPGTLDGPIAYGLRHFAKYADERPALLRVATQELFAINPAVQFLFCRYNSGSPRWSRGEASPRGATTFVPSSRASFLPSNVVEVTVAGTVRLPSGTQVGSDPAGPWRRL